MLGSALILWFVLFSQSSFAQELWDGRYPYRNSFFTPVAVDQVPILNGRFIWPNEEGDADQVLWVKNRSGALISVGTFRTLNVGTIGGFSEIIQVDYDVLTVAFNRLILEFLREAKTREEFLVLLLGDELRPGFETRLGFRGKSAYLSSILFHAVIGKPQLNSDICSRLPLVSISYFHRLGLHQDQAFNQPPVGVQSAGLCELLPAWIFQSYDLGKYVAVGGGFDESTILGSDVLYDRARKLARDGKISVVLLDLTSRESFMDFVKTLNENGTQISAVDISNAGDSDVALRVKILENLTLLPWGDGSAVLETSLSRTLAKDFFGYLSQQTKAWDYRAYSSEYILFELNKARRLVLKHSFR